MSSNANLTKAKKEANDEFYTQYNDIENEVSHYKDQLKGLVVYCNCDSEKSNFWKFFVDKFDEYKLKGLIATHYEKDKKSYRLDYDGVTIKKTDLEGNGDFDSEECRKIAKEESDIIITNPPFSLFRKFIKMLEEV